MKTYRALAMQRTEAERQRRHIHGDRGAKFSAAKILVPRKDELANTLTSALKDNLIIEISDG